MSGNLGLLVSHSKDRNPIPFFTAVVCVGPTYKRPRQNLDQKTDDEKARKKENRFVARIRIRTSISKYMGDQDTPHGIGNEHRGMYVESTQVMSNSYS